ncbi:TPA: DUF2787 domain-containing protein [Vibrio parahaemolyticus]|nr:DUF2787 domain-containing protein [Vibrio parahaemolyticus]HCH5494721.1 DUF2787 domain-containing protein [Vibrio parahaemolyticus]HCH6275972.1 DUF2787 domain-containing protein [Vibrio parahaemolyticus]HCH6312403.1 DUF2787 domain-containing protein [Vibrio parahaemolyticus]HCH6482989.1 DUF2787 domain-containing protein [Vibrio parahaemolyticus]
MTVISDQLCTKSIHTATCITLNFRDSTYSPTEGGYHPVEIGLHKFGEHWQLDYITDFTYVGNPYPELEKEIDFNFVDEVVYVIFSGDFPFTNPDSIKLYEIWENNFTCYVEMGCFDEIEVTTVS